MICLSQAELFRKPPFCICCVFTHLLAHANDMKIVRIRDAQCNSEESP